ALCSCMMTIMGIRARDENIDLEGMQANVTKIMAANPRKISKIKIVFTKTDLQATPNQLEMLKQAALTCPVALSINEDISQEVTFNFS
ncbi:MAG: OsmC family protein, partial [Fulvivirga sp.]|nr:OsmC family protein [Fulvivirga sp.]